VSSSEEEDSQADEAEAKTSQCWDTEDYSGTSLGLLGGRDGWAGSGAELGVSSVGDGRARGGCQAGGALDDVSLLYQRKKRK